MKLPFGLEITRQTIDEKQSPGVITGQLRDSWDQSFWGSLGLAVSSNQNLDLYDHLRGNIPPLDVMPSKWFRLMNTFEVTNTTDAVKKKIDDFIENIPVGRFGEGFWTWLYQVFDSALSKGMGIGEMIPSESEKGIDHLMVAKANDFCFVKDEGRLWLAQKHEMSMQPQIIRDMETVLYFAPDQRDGHPQGYSIYYSLPFITQIFYRMETAIDNTMWRVGDPTFLVTIEGGKEVGTEELKNAMSQLKSGFQAIMKARRKGRVGDVFAPMPKESKLSVTMLGGDVKLDYIEFPMNLIIDQIISKSDLPDWMLGFHRSTTERLSTNQADMIVSKVEWYRDQLEPVIRKVINYYLLLSGSVGAEWGLEWGPVNLLDEKEQAQARLYDATAKLKELECIERMLALGAYQKPEELEQALRDNGLLKFALSRDKERWLDHLQFRDSVMLSMSLLGEGGNGSHKNALLGAGSEVNTE